MNDYQRSLIERGNKRIENLILTFRRKGIAELAPPMRLLDYGCGAGGFLIAALEMGFDAYGVEVEEARQQQYDGLLKGKTEYLDRFVMYEGNLLPFPSNHFDIIHSWFVLEHVPNLTQGLREMARVLKPGGVIALYTEDARCAYEGHTQLPWPPFMPRQFTAAYLDEWGMKDRADFINDTCFYVTQQQITAILEFFEIQILSTNKPPQSYYKQSLYIRSEEDARQAARALKKLKEENKWAPPTENIVIFGRKTNRIPDNLEV